MVSCGCMCNLKDPEAPYPTGQNEATEPHFTGLLPPLQWPWAPSPNLTLPQWPGKSLWGHSLPIFLVRFAHERAISAGVSSHVKIALTVVLAVPKPDYVFLGKEKNVPTTNALLQGGSDLACEARLVDAYGPVAVSILCHIPSLLKNPVVPGPVLHASHTLPHLILINPLTQPFPVILAFLLFPHLTASSHLKAFALAVPSAWNVFPRYPHVIPLYLLQIIF